ncbi:MAG: KamA family radical SAM protein [Kiritimatiellae bacterium]|nr:KamA family radical SAM protein [Kiritimatiellia bacterium]
MKISGSSSVSTHDWNDWRWQMRHRVRDLAGLDRILRLSEEERAWFRTAPRLPLGITPYYVSLLDRDDPLQPLRRVVVPTVREAGCAPGEHADSLGEEDHEVVPGLIHTYPDKVLFLATHACATYCRYCTRSRCAGRSGRHGSLGSWKAALRYIAAHREVRDVLVSGGDPLVLSDGRIEWLLRALRAIKHVEIIRIGTRVPAVLPQRITTKLVQVIRRYHPVWVSVHFAHPDELTPEAIAACERLADAGIPLMNQTVLLAGINDEAKTMKRLMHGLLRARVRPYYLHQCDQVSGTSHFRAPVEKGVAIIRGLVGHTSGYAVPLYMIDAPGGGGKVPIMPDYVVRRVGEDLLIRNYRGELYRYRDGARPAYKPALQVCREGRAGEGPVPPRP